MPSGPLPKHPDRRRRRNATFAMTPLPADGRHGRTPTWPLPQSPMLAVAEHWRTEAAALEARAGTEDDGRRRNRLLDRAARARATAAQVQATCDAAADLERKIWSRAWTTPMAVQWEKQCWTREVAGYCRAKALAELGDHRAARTAMAYADRLGLNPWSMLRLRWEVAPAPAPDAPRAAVTPISSARADFT